MSINELLANELSVQQQQVTAAISLLDEGATVPFIARYRKEATGGLDDTQLRQLEERLIYLRELEERKQSVLKSIKEQEKLTPILEKSIIDADNKQRLEDLYLPYKPKRTTKGQLAIEAGLEPLANQLWEDPTLNPQTQAKTFINTEHKIETEKAALDGAKYILMERFSEQTDLVAKLRGFLSDEGHIISKLKKDKEKIKETDKDCAKFKDYFEFSEAVNKIPSHRTLALFRGRRSQILDVKIDIKDLHESTDNKSTDNKTESKTENKTTHPAVGIIQSFNQWTHQNRAADDWLAEVFAWTWRVKLHSQLQNELLAQLKESADQEAIKVFAHNLKSLLMAAPAGLKATMGLDPGIRTGVKVAVVDQTGALIAHDTVFPHAPKNDWQGSLATLSKLCKAHNIELISIGNGTASRETDKLVSEMLKADPEINAQKVVVSEAGASVYSASAFAAKEFPKLDVSFRGAVSIARRLQDPLAELVKIEPKSIGVGQYQHDVNQPKLARGLDAVVEDCVNAVGVDVNTASAPLLARISGLNSTIATNIVNFRDQKGPFKNRDALKNVPRFGNKTFEQAAGFLRLMNSDNPLDASAVHPESYPLVEQIAAKYSKKLGTLMGNTEFLSSFQPNEFVSERFGLPTIKDIMAELEKPGRDPRPSFKTAQFKEGIETIKDLKPEMVLEGVVSNVTNFGAFIDIGVHQDGLVHISALSHTFVKDPHQIIKAGDIVKVKVVEIDIDRNRIGLTMRLDDKASSAQTKNPAQKPQQHNKRHKNQKPNQATGPTTKQGKNNRHANATQKSSAKAALPPGKTGTFADLFASAKKLTTEK